MEDNTDRNFEEFSRRVESDFILPDYSSTKDKETLAKYYFNLKTNLKNTEKKNEKKKEKKASDTDEKNKKDDKENTSSDKEKNLINAKNNNINININKNSSGMSGLSSSETEKIIFNGENLQIPKNVKFGTHSNFSLYEAIARELVFQIFHYPEMGYFKYNFKINKNGISDNIIEWLDSKNKENANRFLIEFLDKDITKTNIDYKSEKFNISDEIMDIYNNSKGEQGDEIPFRGDFDFLIPNINSNLLRDIFNDKKLAPFLFYGNINIDNDKDENFDIIGEIKESSEDHQKLLDQIKKYISMMCHFLNEKTNSEQENTFHFNFKRKKILMYVFNGEYKNFLKIMTTFKINRNKFKNLKEYENEESYKNILRNFNDNNENKTHFLRLIIYSGLAFIFLYIPDILYINCKKILDNNKFQKELELYKADAKKKIETLENESNAAKKKMLKMENESNAAKIKMLKMADELAFTKQTMIEMEKKYETIVNELKREIEELKQKINK